MLSGPWAFIPGNKCQWSKKSS